VKGSLHGFLKVIDNVVKLTGISADNWDLWATYRGPADYEWEPPEIETCMQWTRWYTWAQMWPDIYDIVFRSSPDHVKEVYVGNNWGSMNIVQIPGQQRLVEAAWPWDKEGGHRELNINIIMLEKKPDGAASSIYSEALIRELVCEEISDERILDDRDISELGEPNDIRNVVATLVSSPNPGIKESVKDFLTILGNINETMNVDVRNIDFYVDGNTLDHDSIDVNRLSIVEPDFIDGIWWDISVHAGANYPSSQSIFRGSWTWRYHGEKPGQRVIQIWGNWATETNWLGLLGVVPASGGLEEGKSMPSEALQIITMRKSEAGLKTVKDVLTEISPLEKFGVINLKDWLKGIHWLSERMGHPSSWDGAAIHHMSDDYLPIDDVNLKAAFEGIDESTWNLSWDISKVTKFPRGMRDRIKNDNTTISGALGISHLYAAFFDHNDVQTGYISGDHHETGISITVSFWKRKDPTTSESLSRDENLGMLLGIQRKL